MALNKECVLSEDVTDIKMDVRRHFEESYLEPKLVRPTLDGLESSKLSREDNSMLTAPFTDDEIKVGVWSCDRNKSPGPDGFNLGLIKECRDVVKHDVTNFIQEFHMTGIFLKAITTSYLTLIPKKYQSARFEGILSYLLDWMF